MIRPTFTTRTELLADLAALSDLGKIHGLCHRPVTEDTTIAELKRICCDYDAAIANATNGKLDPESIALKEINTAWEEWYAIEERISKGKAYVAANPGDKQAAALLARLAAQAVGAEQAYLRAEATYRAVQA